MADKTPKHIVKFRTWVDGLGENSKAKAAVALGCTEQTIRNILAERKPSLDIAVAIEKKAGIPVDVWAS